MKTGENLRYQRIWKFVAMIPNGRVASYGQIAGLAGLPRGARLVSRALRAAPASRNLPWYRVINSRGQIAIPTDQSVYREQIDLLRAENVMVIGGHVDMRIFGWSPTVDELLWGPLDFSENNNRIERV